MNNMLKEILRGKNIFRAILFSSLVEFFQRHHQMEGLTNILEIGSEKASHQRTFPKNWILKRSNYIVQKDSEHIFDANHPFPFPRSSFDGVIMFNTLYALSNYQSALKESLRVTKSFVLFNIPLISGIAPHPTDYNRFTEDMLKKIISDLGDEVQSYEITPLGGSFSGSVVLLDPYLKFLPLRIVANFFALIFDRMDKLIKRDCPIQYLVYIQKK